MTASHPDPREMELDKVYIQCLECGARAMTVYQFGYMNWDECEQLALDSWNRRTETMIKLKPCPFCGGNAEFKTDSMNAYDGKLSVKFHIECRDCHSSFPACYEYININLDTNGELDLLADNRQKAIDAWNKRPES